MSDQVPTPNDVQPDSGQGAAEAGSGLYDLSSVPEHLRPTVEPILKGFDANVTRKFQEHSEFRKGYEPYEQLGIRDVDPDELRDLLEFRQIAQDPDKFRAWYQEIGPHVLGEDGDDDLDGAEDLGQGDGGGQSPDVSSLVEKAVQQALQPFMAERQQAEHEKAVQQELQAISAEMDALEQQHGKFNRDRVSQLALSYGDDPKSIEKAFADYQDLINEAKRGFVEGRLEQPVTPNQGGAPASQVQPPTSFADAREAALGYLRNSATASS
jgi:hypothetical protein